MFLVLDGDQPIYECNFAKPQKLQSYFSIHAALDSADTEIANRKDFYLGQLKNQDSPIFCFVNPVNLKLLLYFPARRDFDKRADMAIRDFFIQVNRQLANALLNPLYKRKQPIRSQHFEEKVMEIGKQYLRQFFVDHKKK